MLPKTTCPCCSYPLLRHARQCEVYWFCPHCYQEMPVVTQNCDRLPSPKTLVRTSERSDKVLLGLAQ